MEEAEGGSDRYFRRHRTAQNIDQNRHFGTFVRTVCKKRISIPLPRTFQVSQKIEDAHHIFVVSGKKVIRCVYFWCRPCQPNCIPCEHPFANPQSRDHYNSEPRSQILQNCESVRQHVLCWWCQPYQYRRVYFFRKSFLTDWFHCRLFCASLSAHTHALVHACISWVDTINERVRGLLDDKKPTFRSDVSAVATFSLT